ncbi:hypothetical protein MLD38_018418 [Melastoma candidum]|uniref:Uncharacterized protein n=1 Tax=Melastoma candidum TaxID=119954 RepID=A0ACB9QVP1_9MYRT|nr:hypothetical protein MLD38_018418 [Melastoma candidum]
MVISTGQATAGRGCGYSYDERQRLRKLLIHVTVGRYVGAVRVVVSQEDTVVDLVVATGEAYRKEMRRPLLGEKDPRLYRLHYSPFCWEGIEPDENVMNLGSRNFFLCTSPILRSSSPSSSPSRATIRSNPPSSCSPRGLELISVLYIEDSDAVAGMRNIHATFNNQ